MSELPTLPEIEIEPRERIHDLLHLAPEELTSLQERLAKFDGTMRIFIHPLYNQYRGTYQKSKENTPVIEKNKKVQEFLQTILGTNLDQCPPTLLMEEGSVSVRDGADIKHCPIMPDLKELYKTWMQDSDNEIYLAQTGEATGTPLTLDIPPGVEQDDFINCHQDEMWDRFAGKLKQAGVKKIILGGGEFVISPYDREDMCQEEVDYRNDYVSQRLESNPKNEDMNVNYRQERCAGFAAPTLARYFDVEVSNFAFPHSHRQILRYEKNNEHWEEERVRRNRSVWKKFFGIK